MEQRRLSVALPCRPFGKLCFDSRDHSSDGREILVVDAELSGEFPHSFYGIEIGAVRWKVIKAKLRFMFLTPSAVKFGVVIFGVVGNDDHAAPAIETAALKQTQEVPCGHGIKAVEFARKNEFAIPKSYCAEVANTLARGVMV
jgi:hypothetical protein